MAPDPEDLIVTTGGQQAIDLIAKTLVNPGDPVICEAPTYPGAVPTFCSYEAEVHQVRTDNDGMRIDELEELLASLSAAGRQHRGRVGAGVECLFGAHRKAIAQRKRR